MQVKKILKRTNGFVGADVSIAIILILMFIPTIFGITYNIQKTNKAVERQTIALDIATKVMEKSKKISYDNLTINALSYGTYMGNNEYGYTGSQKEYYKIEVGVANYYPAEIEEAEKMDLIKKVNVKVTYTVGQTERNVELSTYVIKS